MSFWNQLFDGPALCSCLPSFWLRTWVVRQKVESGAETAQRDPAVQLWSNRHQSSKG